MSWISRLRNAVRPERAAADLDDELRFHFEERVDHYVREGLSRREAERAARLKFGGALQVREESREVKSAAWLESLVADFRFGLRVLRRSRNASLAAIASLGLAIGACGTAFALLDALVFRPLPLPQPERLVRIVRVMPEFMGPNPAARESDTFSYPQFELLRQTGRDAADFFALSLSGGLQSAQFDDAGGSAENVRADAIDGRAFRALRVKAAFGRLIQADDDGRSVAVLGYGFWKRRFGASPSAVGRWVNIGGRQFQIVGVAERGFSGLQPGYLTDVWLSLAPSSDPDRGAAQVWARLHPHASAEWIAPRLEAAMVNFMRDRTRVNPPRGLNPEQVRQLAEAPLRLRDASRGRDSLFRARFATPLRIFGLICALLLLVACSNVANLLIARSAAREAETALRVSLGAGRARLVQQALVESGQMAAAATAIAVVLAAFAAPALGTRLGTTELPAWLDVALDGRTAGFALAISLLTTALCGAAPAWRAASSAPRPALQSGGRVRPLRWMLAAQVGFCVAVLFLSGLLLLTFRKLVTVDLGFARENLALFDLAPRARGAAASPAGLMEAARRVPGVQSASLSRQRPMGGDMVWIVSPWIRLPGGHLPARPLITRSFGGREYLSGSLQEVGVAPAFFDTLGVRRIAGRDFLPEETEKPSSTVIVNQAFSELFFQGLDPIGQEFETLADDPEPSRRRIVGVVGNTRWNNVRADVAPTIYAPMTNAAGATLIVRRAGGTAAAAAEMRRTIEAASPAVTVRASTLLSSQIDDLLVRERLLASLAGLVSGAALLLAAVGIYGVIHFSAVRRTREIGIRLALGAPRGSVVRLMVGETSAPVALGIAAGVAVGIGLAGRVTSQLFGVEPTDFWSVAAPVVCVAIAAIAALLPPALRASKADPAAVLRAE